jgi:hypothetical protein
MGNKFPTLPLPYQGAELGYSDDVRADRALEAHRRKAPELSADFASRKRLSSKRRRSFAGARRKVFPLPITSVSRGANGGIRINRGLSWQFFGFGEGRELFLDHFR